MKRIENTTSRQVTFSKRRNGLLKKAYELSVLCDAEVAVIIFSQKGRVYEFSSSDLQKTVERYRKNTKEVQIDMPHTELYTEKAKQEIGNMVKKIELLEVSQRRLLGQELGSCSIEELQEIDGQLEQSLRSIRARKSGAKSSPKLTEAIRNFIPSCQTSEVETDLFIGLPYKKFHPKLPDI
ncbi:hypothetical protein LWI29_032745 [Acer saccharum]|uniref:Uncharacterized protein n=1 Tax=Acer saccharum TaxID=4024 RepID=A0AA39SXM9_ACESA|nr:hypothetical protein LWI29_032745 [Acer saccharum]